MSKRCRKLVQLALNNSENVFDSVNKIEEKNKDSEQRSVETDSHIADYPIKEFEKDEDPWIAYKNWKSNEMGDYNRLEISNEEQVEDNHQSSTEYIDSSTSWQADANEKSDSTSETHSSISEEIPYNEPIVLKVKSDTREGAIESCRSGSKKITILQNISLPPVDEPKNVKPTAAPCVGIIGDSKKIVDVSHRRSRKWDKRDRCIYCNRDCTNYSRHLIRNHSNEDSVRQIIQLPKGHKKRKLMINLLRKEGNLSLIDENKIRPVQRATQKYNLQNEEQTTQEFMPCPYCKGIYRLASLRKHSKICAFNEKTEKHNVASLGQNLLIFKASRQAFLHKLRLTNEVFPKMHADRASFNGKNDPVVCQYAEDYLRKHKRPHIVSAVSNKIREVGRLLIPLQDLYSIGTVLEALNTVHYDKVVHAAQIISGYDATLKLFKSPSLAMHLKTILLSLCLAAKTLLLKQDPVLPVTNYAEMLHNVKQFKLLVDERWRFDMSSLALKDLNEKHGKKAQAIPITSDVIKFRNFVESVADKSVEVLNKNINDVSSFKNLTEAVLALTILINRKRIGDVQYTKLESYTLCTTNSNQEECLNVLSESEKLLSKYFKRIVTIGKGSKTIPILFPKNIQTYMDVLLSCRQINGLVPKENVFLFALVGSKDKWVNGSFVLRKYASTCGADNPKSLTSSRLRKQIATVLQLINLNETEKEQMASFMGHTKKTHEEFYRLPQDVFQTAKIAKLLLMMDKGKGSQFHGKTLDEIDVQLENLSRENRAEIASIDEINDKENVQTEGLLENPDYDLNLRKNEETNDKEDAQTNGFSKNLEYDLNSQENDATSSVRQKKDKVKKNERGSWNAHQKLLMKDYFKKHIRSKIAPKKHECLELQNKHKTEFINKNWVQIKVFVYNTFKNQK